MADDDQEHGALCSSERVSFTGGPLTPKRSSIGSDLGARISAGQSDAILSIIPTTRNGILAMKCISLLFSILLLSIELTEPLLAQNPAVRMTPGITKEDVKVAITNLNTTSALTIAAVVLVVFDQGSCWSLCGSEKKINRTLKPCESIVFDVRCSKKLGNKKYTGQGYIYWLHVIGGFAGHPSGHLTESWLFLP